MLQINRIHRHLGCQQSGHGLTAVAHVHRHRFELAGNYLNTGLAQGIGTRLAPPSGAGVVAPDQAHAAVAAFDNVLGHCLADGLVGKADHSVDRVLR